MRLESHLDRLLDVVVEEVVSRLLLREVQAGEVKTPAGVVSGGREFQTEGDRDVYEHRTMAGQAATASGRPPLP